MISWVTTGHEKSASGGGAKMQQINLFS